MKISIKHLLVLAISCLLLTSCSKDDPIEAKPDKFNIDLDLAYKNDLEMSTHILELINDHRDTLGLAPIQMDSQYASALAVDHSMYMISKKQISHDNFKYRSQAIKYYSNAENVGENIAYGYKSAEKVVEAWLKSPGHKAIIDGNYTHTGFGVMKSEKGRVYITQLFYRK